MTTLNKIILGASLSLAIFACGGGTGPYGGGVNNPPPPPPPANTVNATSALAFSPRALTVPAGQPVTFKFGSIAHNVIFDAPGGATPADIAGGNANVSVQRTFTAPGTYAYHCNIHPGMNGSVTVQ